MLKQSSENNFRKMKENRRRNKEIKDENEKSETD